MTHHAEHSSLCFHAPWAMNWVGRFRKVIDTIQLFVVYFQVGIEIVRRRKTRVLV